MSFRCPPSSAGPAGKLDVPMLLKVNLRRRRTVWARVPMIHSRTVGKQITVDADLSEWPLGEGNTAGAFGLLGRRGQVGDGLARDQTTVFVAHDATNVYLAFRCNRPGEARLQTTATNVLRWEQLLLADEDLVEVIFDPGADAKGPEELYRLVIKANGISVGGKGLPIGPSMATGAPWATQAAVAVRPGPNAWIVELAVPRAAFGAEGSSRQWGVNFVRYDTRNAESSSWSRPPRHYYDPKGLGALFFTDDGQPPAAGGRGGTGQ